MLSKNLWFIRAALPPSLGGAVLYNKGKDAELKRAIQQAQVMEKKGEAVSMRQFFSEAMNEARTEERRLIMDRMIADGMDPSKAAIYVGLTAVPNVAANFAGLPVP